MTWKGEVIVRGGLCHAKLSAKWGEAEGGRET